MLTGKITRFIFVDVDKTINAPKKPPTNIETKKGEFFSLFK